MMPIIDRPASEIIQNPGTPLVVLNTGYAALATGGEAARKRGHKPFYT